jgi:lipoyl-dependent peroxiredoxin
MIVATITAETMIIHLSQLAFATKKALKAMLGITVHNATTFDLMVIPLPRFQSMMAGPTYLFDSKALRNFLDPLAKQKAANMKKTRPGMRGRIYPMMPSPVKKNPSATQRGFFTATKLAVKRCSSFCRHSLALLSDLYTLKKTSMKRHATAVWKGSGKEGTGTISTETGVLKEINYDWKSRFADGTNTNPEELIAAAHASCFSMKLSFLIGNAGSTADRIETRCEVSLENGSITASHLIVKAEAAGLTREQIASCIEDARQNCPVSKILSIPVTLEIL